MSASCLSMGNYDNDPSVEPAVIQVLHALLLRSQV